MTANLLYALGTLAAWIGVGLIFRGVVVRSGRVANAVTGGLLLVLAAATPAVQGGFGIPLVWPAMPFVAWATVTSFAVAGAQMLRAFLDGDARRWRAAGVWMGLAVACVIAYRSDAQNQIEILRGRILLSPASALGLGALASAAVALMASLGRRAVAGARLLALVAGCVVFGLPFAWMLLTSFKEDRDMGGPGGLVWIPRVQRTVPYEDPQNPLLEGTYRGVQVQATLAGRESDGAYFVEVQRPTSLRGLSFSAPASAFRTIPREAPVVQGAGFTGFVARELPDGRRLVRFLSPEGRIGEEKAYLPSDLEPVRDIGLRTQNYVEALEAMPVETRYGLVYLRNTLLLVVLSVGGTILSSSIVAFGFARLRFPGRDLLFKILLATMMLPGAVTLLPQFLLFREFHWVDTLYPLWVPAFFASAFNVFLLRQFFRQIPTELEDAAKIDGAGVLRTFWGIMLPQIRPALAVVAIWTFMGAWNNFMGPLIYINSPENMPLSYALQLFQSERGGSPGLMMAFATLTLLPVLLLFFLAQRTFIDGVTLSGLGGR